MDQLLKKLEEKCIKNNAIDKELYQTYSVKRGLRNKDGSGVLVGLTQVSSVIGYEKVDEETVPVEGRLSYRGIDLMNLVKGLESSKPFGYEEIAYLLLFGELPTGEEFDEFLKVFAQERKLPKRFMRDMIMTFGSKNLMNSLARSVLALYTTDSNPDDVSISNLIRQAISLVAKMPSLTAYAYQAYADKYLGQDIHIRKPQDNLSAAENFLSMLRADGKYTEVEAKILDLLLVLHADHGGGNNSTFTTRVVSSSGSDSYAVIAASLGSLKGPLHGGANKSVMDMMADIKENVKDWDSKDEVSAYLNKILHKEVGDLSGKIYGFGHAVYTKSDPRAVVLKDYAIKLAKEKDREKELDLYMLIESLVPEVFNSYKGTGKPISPNVDFYSGFVYSSLGFTEELYTPLFAMGRVAGWMAHRIEELMGSKKIIRPAYKNVAQQREYASIDSR